MAFSETDIGKICRILQINRIAYDKVAMYYGHYVTAEVETQVGDLISEWFDTDVGSDTVAVAPNTANFGAVIDPEARRIQIREDIGILLMIPDDVMGGGSIDSFEIVRG